MMPCLPLNGKCFSDAGIESLPSKAVEFDKFYGKYFHKIGSRKPTNLQFVGGIELRFPLWSIIFLSNI